MTMGKERFMFWWWPLRPQREKKRCFGLNQNFLENLKSAAQSDFFQRKVY